MAYFQIAGTVPVGFNPVRVYVFGHHSIGPLIDPVTWYGINYAEKQLTQWDFQNKGTLTSPVRLLFVLKVPLRYLRPCIINFVTM